MGYALEGAARGAAFEAGTPDGGESGDVKDVSHAVYARARRTLGVCHSTKVSCPQTALKKERENVINVGLFCVPYYISVTFLCISGCVNSICF